MRFGGRECVLRLPGKDTELLGIDREAERLASERRRRAGHRPRGLVAGRRRCLVTAFVETGAPSTAGGAARHPASGRRALRAFHDRARAAGALLGSGPARRDYAASRGASAGRACPEPYAQTHALRGAPIADALPLSDPVPCHDDLLPGNILARVAEPDRAVLVDWEYAGMGHRLFDLGNLAVNNDFDEPVPRSGC